MFADQGFSQTNQRDDAWPLRCRGLAKNTAQRLTLFGLANLVLAGWRWRAQHARTAS